MVIVISLWKKDKHRVYEDEMESHNEREICGVMILDSSSGCLTRSVGIFFVFSLVVSFIYYIHTELITFNPFDQVRF